MKLLRVPEVTEKVGFSRVSIWRLEAAGEFPQRQQITSKTVGWIEAEVNQWIASRHRVERREQAPGGKGTVFSRWSTKLEVAGSSPAGRAFFATLPLP